MNKQFTILHKDNAAYVDKSFLAKDFASDAFGFVPVAAEDKMLVGFYKFVPSFYVEVGTVKNAVANTITAKYYHATDGWTALDIIDETQGFTASGFIFFRRPKDTNFNELASTVEVDSKTLVWLELTFSEDHTASSTIKGIAPLFSNDKDLEEERSNITDSDLLGSTLASWVLKHQASRKQIVQDIRNKGNIKYRAKADTSTGTSKKYENVFSNITEFDILDFDEIRQASKFLTLSKIFHQELSDKADDKYSVLGKYFYEQFTRSFSLFFLKLDIDDDGEEGEDDVAKSTKIIDIVRE